MSEQQSQSSASGVASELNDELGGTGLVFPPVAYEYRNAHGDYAWSEWKRVEPRSPYTDTVEDRVREINTYIRNGQRYQLRALYAGMVPDDVLVPPNARANG